MKKPFPSLKIIPWKRHNLLSDYNKMLRNLLNDKVYWTYQDRYSFNISFGILLFRPFGLIGGVAKLKIDLAIDI